MNMLEKIKLRNYILTKLRNVKDGKELNAY